MTKTEQLTQSYIEKLENQPKQTAIKLFSYCMDEYYSDELKKLGANAECKAMKPHMRSLLLHVRF